MTLASMYYTRGYTRDAFVGSSHERLMAVLTQLFVDGPKEGFTWEQKYPNTLDLRPDAHSYDSSIIDVLFESNVPELLNAAIGVDMVLFHTQVRKSFPGPSYMSWHRDSYDHGKPVGNFPPVHKVIFYPSIPGTSYDKKLDLCVGSHLRHMGSQEADVSCLVSMPIKQYYPSQNEFILFNTSMLHAACPDDEPSIRVIYSFIRRIQFEELYADQTVHAKQVATYEEKLKA